MSAKNESALIPGLAHTPQELSASNVTHSAMENLGFLLAALGAEVLDWDFKTECCGAGLSLSKTEKVVELSGRLVREAAFRGADAVVVACQLCQANLDMRQGQAGIPIIYFTQLMGLAFGPAPAALGQDHHLVDPLALLEQKGLTA